MKVKHVKGHWLPKLIRVEAITIYPFIFYYTKKPSKTLMQHEMIHIDQVRKEGWLKFYISYLFEYFKLYLRYKDMSKAYFAISYEIEAYDKEHIDRKNFD